MRLFLKTMSYAIMHILVAVAVAYILTQNIYIALAIGLIEPVVQTIFFSFHEYMWERKRNINIKPIGDIR